MSLRNKIVATAKRYDGQIKYMWPLTVLEEKSDLFVLGGSSGRILQYQNKRSITLTQPSIEFYWCDRWYTIAANINDDKSVNIWYCNICLPPLQITSTELGFVDLELDVVVQSDLSWEIVDQEEFQSAVVKFQIPEKIVTQAWSAAKSLGKMVEERAWPFNQS